MTVVSWVEFLQTLFAKSKWVLKQGCFTSVQWMRIQQKSQSWMEGFQCSHQEDEWCNCPTLPSLSYSQIKFKLLYSTPTVCTSHKLLCWFTRFTHENYRGGNGRNLGSSLSSTPNNPVLCLPRKKQLVWRPSIKQSPRQSVDKMMCLNVIKLNPRQTGDRNV